jgi:hypothetical protein
MRTRVRLWYDWEGDEPDVRAELGGERLQRRRVNNAKRVRAWGDGRRPRGGCVAGAA